MMGVYKDEWGTNEIIDIKNLAFPSWLPDQGQWNGKLIFWVPLCTRSRCCKNCSPTLGQWETLFGIIKLESGLWSHDEGSQMINHMGYVLGLPHWIMDEGSDSWNN